MEVRRDPRSFLFLIILFLLINSPEPQSPAYGRPRIDEVIETEYINLELLNRTRYGDFNARKNQYLNLTGFRREDGFAWDELDSIQQAAKGQSQRILGDRWKSISEGRLEDRQQNVPVHKNLSGYVQGEWTRSPMSRVRHPSDMGNSSLLPDMPLAHLADFDRNLTGMGGPLRLHITESEDRMRRNRNKTISEIKARIVIGDYDSFGGKWWQFMAHGIHFLKTGTVVLTTTSDRFAGIFALPHFQITQHMYAESQEFLHHTIHEAIKRQETRPLPLWNPWTSSVDGGNEALFQGYHCEFVLYLQEIPSRYDVDMDWLEHEMRYPTGASIAQHAQFSLSMVGFSPDCGFIIESKGPHTFPPSDATYLVGSKTEDFNNRARYTMITFAAALAFQLSFLMKQMKETATPSMRSRISFYTMATMAFGDGFTLLVLIFMYVFLGSAQLVSYSIAFLALFSVVAHLKFMMDIWSVQSAERARQERQQASAAASIQPLAMNTPAQPAPDIDGGLPLPATAPRPRPPTPIIIAPDQDDPADDTNATNTNNTVGDTNPRAEFGSLYSRFCLILIITFFISIQFSDTRTMYRTMYFDLISFLYLSFWVPQIHRNIMRNCRRALRWDYVIGTSIFRLLPVAYFYLIEENILFSKTEWTSFAVLVCWMWFQIVALASQDILGPRFFIKDGWAPPAYDYHPILREDEEGAAMPLNVTRAMPLNVTSGDANSPGTLEESSSSLDPLLLSNWLGESRSKGKKVFDCSICAQDIEVPVIPAGADEASVASVGSTSMILQRRQYMVTPCKHVFHTACLESWMKYRLQCPNCRESLPPL